MLVNVRYVPEGIGGPARSLGILAERMVRDGHSVRVVCRGASRGARERRRGVEVLRLPPGLDDAGAARALGEEIRRTRPEVVHTNFLRGFDKAATARVLAGVRSGWVHTLREYSLLCREGLLLRDQAVCRSLCAGCRELAERARPFANGVDAVVGVSSHVLQRHLAEGLFDRVAERRVIPNSYDTPETAVPMARGDRGLLRAGYLGRLSPEKGLDHLLEAVAGLSSGTALELLVAGRLDTAYARQLQRRFDGRRIRFVGYADPARFLPAIDVLVCPSICEETFGRGVIEAFAHGVPVIVSDRGALHELVEPGRTGWLYPPEEPARLQQIILSILSDRGPLGAMEVPCREAARRFTTERVLQAYYEVYRGSAARAAG